MSGRGRRGPPPPPERASATCPRRPQSAGERDVQVRSIDPRCSSDRHLHGAVVRFEFGDAVDDLDLPGAAGAEHGRVEDVVARAPPRSPSAAAGRCPWTGSVAVAVSSLVARELGAGLGVDQVEVDRVQPDLGRFDGHLELGRADRRVRRERPGRGVDRRCVADQRSGHPEHAQHQRELAAHRAARQTPVPPGDSPAPTIRLKAGITRSRLIQPRPISSEQQDDLDDDQRAVGRVEERVQAAHVDVGLDHAGHRDHDHGARARSARTARASRAAAGCARGPRAAGSRRAARRAGRRSRRPTRSRRARAARRRGRTRRRALDARVPGQRRRDREIGRAERDQTEQPARRSASQRAVSAPVSVARASSADARAAVSAARLRAAAPEQRASRSRAGPTPCRSGFRACFR